MADDDDAPAELATFSSREAYVYAPLPPAPHYGHRAELWDVNKWLTVRGAWRGACAAAARRALWAPRGSMVSVRRGRSGTDHLRWPSVARACIDPRLKPSTHFVCSLPLRACAQTTATVTHPTSL
jgi:hypothetical protein